ncbi:serine protease filzig [Chelonus insularis]|uniref:serine protease filzig n=1 Tax=Chelonus insularis TaxID=460826 RepID=UPI00158C6F9E|nr:serine protease filzig [Chelonus insularis]
MESRKYILLLAYLTIISGFSISDKDHSRGRKLFGGYRIVPKVCQPTSPSRIQSNQPAICMFNYECSQRNGQVVGACMDGFLFGACCQLPPNYQTSEILQEQFNYSKIPMTETTNSHITTIQTTKPPSPVHHEDNKNISQVFTSQDIDDLSIPGIITHADSHNDLQEKESPEVNPVTTFLRPDQILQISDPVDQLPGLFSQGIGASNFSGADTVLVDKNGTVIDNKISSDSIFRPDNRSTLGPNYSVNFAGSTTRMQPSQYMNTNKIIDSTTIPSTSGLVRVPTINYGTPVGIKKDDDDEFTKNEMSINHILTLLNSSTPNAGSPTHVTQQIHSTNGGSSVQSWSAVENTSKPSTAKLTYPYTYYKPVTKPTNYYYYNTGSPTSSFSTSTKARPTRPSNLVFSSDYSPKYPSTGSSSSSTYFLSTKPTTLPPAPTVIVLGPLGTSDFTSATTPKFTTKQPLTTTPSSAKPSLLTKKPPQATITHNISTVISTDSSADTSATSNIISTSFINVKFKDTSTSKPAEALQSVVPTKKPSTVWTTLSTWSNKPSFQLRPGQPDFAWPDTNFTPIQTIVLQSSTKPVNSPSSTEYNVDDDRTAAPDEMSNFPPDRNPNLTNSTPISQAEKPTIVENGYPAIEIIGENEIPTPSLIEDEVLTNKVDDFVNKIVDSLQDNFQDLKDIVYNKKNISAVSTSSPAPSATRKPTTVKRPTPKPSSTKKPPTRRPTSSPKPGTAPSSANKPVKVTRPAKPTSTTAPLSAGVITKRPSVSSSSPTSSKRPKPTKKVTTTVTPTTTVEISSVSTIQIHHNEPLNEPTQGTTRAPDYRRECGVRPLVQRARVVGGKSATFGEWPWQVLVREATWLGLFTKNKCGGVLITDKYVITAAHCQPGFLASLVAVFGEFDISGELESRRSVSRNVRRVIVHRAYNPATFENDLAILELESPIEFDAHIVPICMPEDGIDFTGKVATVTGWGRVKYNGGVPSVLQEVQVPIIENSVCQDMFRTAGHSKLILDSFLCAGYANGQKDSCEGDSGGPLMMERPDGKWFLVGTVSHGIKCAAPYLPGVYMRTTYFKPWLHAVTGV